MRRVKSSLSSLEEGIRFLLKRSKWRTKPDFKRPIPVVFWLDDLSGVV